MKENEIPDGATHTRDGDFYKVNESCVKYLDYSEWKVCENGTDVSGWLEELTPIT